MKSYYKTAALALVIGSSTALAGCQGPVNKTAAGVGIGAGVGAGVGALVGGPRGALIGAGLGAAAGGVTGHQIQKKQNRR